jgi:hypothetical protein
MATILIVLAVAALILVVALGVGAIILVKMGVIAKYLFKEEPADPGDYEIGQSREVQ